MKHRHVSYSILIIISLFMVGLVMAQDSPSEDEMFRNLGCWDAEAYEEFLAAFPDGGNAKSIRLALDLMQQIEQVQSEEEISTLIIPHEDLGDYWAYWQEQYPETGAIGYGLQGGNLFSVFQPGCNVMRFDANGNQAPYTGDGSLLTFATNGQEFSFVGDLTIKSERNETLYFAILTEGLVYLRGKGSVTLADGTVVGLPPADSTPDETPEATDMPEANGTSSPLTREESQELFDSWGPLQLMRTDGMVSWGADGSVNLVGNIEIDMGFETPPVLSLVNEDGEDHLMFDTLLPTSDSVAKVIFESTEVNGAQFHIPSFTVTSVGFESGSSYFTVDGFADYTDDYTFEFGAGKFPSGVFVTDMNIFTDGAEHYIYGEVELFGAAIKSASASEPIVFKISNGEYQHLGGEGSITTIQGDVVIFQPIKNEPNASSASPTAPNTPTSTNIPTSTSIPTATSKSDLFSACLVTDLGGLHPGTFSQFAYDALTRASADFDIETTLIESMSPSDFEANINACIDDNQDVIVTVGFLLGDATLMAAEANPDVYFIGVDQFFEGHPVNLVGLQFREDQAGFLAGVMAALMTESNVVGGVYGIEIPPVVKFRHGFEQGVRYVKPDATILGVYITSFVAPAEGAAAAENFIDEGADVIFGAGGATGSGAIQFAASEHGVKVIGVDHDEYFTTFGGGEVPGSENIITSVLRAYDVGVYDVIRTLIVRDSEWMGGGLYVLEAANDGIALAPSHDSNVPAKVLSRVEEVSGLLKSGAISTGVDPVTGELQTNE